MQKACQVIGQSSAKVEEEMVSHGEEHHHDHDHGNSGNLKTYFPAIISFVLVVSGIVMDHFQTPAFFQNENIRVIWYVIAYFPVAIPILYDAYKLLRKGDFFNEFSLMSIATLGAFALKEYPEAVSVMLFYSVGELLQHAAVDKSKRNIESLLQFHPEETEVFRENQWEITHPEEIEPGEILRIKAGEKVPLDGVMLSEYSSFNTSALTGESKPATLRKGEPVLSGMLNLDKVIEIKTTKRFEDSSMARILHLIQDASTRKAKTELFIRKFAKIYTPVVFFLAVTLVIFPYFFVQNYVFQEWFYRALIFLVISCPCALLISIPLGYFGGIGAASKNGILVKGSNFLDLLAKADNVFMDKTGTLTKGVFKVQKVEAAGISSEELLNLISALESNSTHPIAKAITESHPSSLKVEKVEEISGHGLKGIIDGKVVLAGNEKLMKEFDIKYDTSVKEIIDTIIIVAVDGKYSGYITIADEVKEDAKSAIQNLKNEGVSQTIMLSGDKDAIVQKTAKELGIDRAFGDLLPEGKVEKIEESRKNPEKINVFAGDGINDAPVLTISDVGIAMGAMGSDVAIETADVVIQTDQPSKIATAIKIGKKTKQVVIQNIVLAFGVKVLVLILGAGGMATMWEAIFADVGVAFLAILNAVRIQRMKF